MPDAAYPLIRDTAEAQAITTRITVEVDLYSGRPNPVVGLSTTQAAELERRIGMLPAAAGDAAIQDALGYRGLRITAENAGFREVVVSNGVVEIRDRAGRASRKADPRRALERWLVDAASPHLSADQRAWLDRDVPR